jgi:hypothetical protein
MKNIILIISLSLLLFSCKEVHNTTETKIFRKESISNQRALANLLETWPKEDIEKFKSGFVFTTEQIDSLVTHQTINR